MEMNEKDKILISIYEYLKANINLKEKQNIILNI